MHISRHVKMDLVFFVVPRHVYSNVSGSHPIGLDLIVFLEDGHEVVSVLFSYIFDAEVINNKCERYRSRGMLP